MAHARKHEDEGPENPAGPVEDAEDEERGDDAAAGPAVDCGRDGIEDVAAIELAGGDEVERGDEEAHPGGDQDRVRDDEAERTRRRDGEVEQSVHGREGERRLHGVDDGSRGNSWTRLRPRARATRAMRKPAMGPAAPMTRRAARVAMRDVDADDGAEGSGERRGGQQLGEGGADAEVAAGEVVAELVREQDADEGEREGQAARRRGGDGRPKRKGGCRRRGEGRAGRG